MWTWTSLAMIGSRRDGFEKGCYFVAYEHLQELDIELLCLHGLYDLRLS